MNQSRKIPIPASTTSGPILELEGGIRIIAVSDLSALSAYSESWNRLALSRPDALPTSSYAWVASYLEHQLAPDESWLCFLALRNENLLGVLPLLIVPHRVWGRRHPRLRMPGNYHTVSVDALVENGACEKIMAAFLRAIQKTFPRFLSLEFRRLPESSCTLGFLRSGSTHLAAACELDGYGNHVAVNDSFTGYIDSLSRNFRRNLKKKGNKIGELPAVRVAFHGRDEITDRHLADFLEVEASGWKGQAGSAIKQSPTLTAFYSALHRRLRELGWLEYHFLHSEQKILAGHFAVRFGRVLYIDKIGYDEAYAHCSPGNYLFLKNLERTFAAHDADLIDCLSDEPWHQNWHVNHRAYYNIYLFPHRLTPFLFGLLPRHLRRMARNIPFLSNLYRRLRQNRSHEK